MPKGAERPNPMLLDSAPIGDIASPARTRLAVAMATATFEHTPKGANGTRVQVKHPVIDRWVKLDTTTGRIARGALYQRQGRYGEPPRTAAHGRLSVPEAFARREFHSTGVVSGRVVLRSTRFGPVGGAKYLIAPSHNSIQL